MGDEDNSDATGRHAPDGVQQSSGLLLRQNGGGLVQDQQLELVLAQLTGDLGELLMTNGHIADDHVLVDLHAHFVNGLCGLGLHFFIIERIQPGAEHLGNDVLLLGLTIEQNVFRGSKARDQRELLMHHADTGLQCVKGRIKGDFFTIDEDVAAVAAGFPDDVHTEQDLHQRGFTRAVFACQAQDLTSLQGEVDVRQDLVAEEVFFDAAHLQQGSRITFHK